MVSAKSLCPKNGGFFVLIKTTVSSAGKSNRNIPVQVFALGFRLCYNTVEPQDTVDAMSL